MSQLQDVCEKLKITARVRYGNKVTIEDEWQKTATPYTVTLRFRGKRLTTPYFTGSALTEEPTAADVLSSLVVDASCGELSFDEFCRDYGYDTDSRKAERTWKACVWVAPKIRAFLGDAFDEIANAEH